MGPPGTPENPRCTWCAGEGNTHPARAGYRLTGICAHEHISELLLCWRHALIAVARVAIECQPCLHSREPHWCAIHRQRPIEALTA